MAVRCAPAPAAEAKIMLLTWKTRMMCFYQCVLCLCDCMCVYADEHMVTVGDDDLWEGRWLYLGSITVSQTGLWDFKASVCVCLHVCE